MVQSEVPNVSELEFQMELSRLSFVASKPPSWILSPGTQVGDGLGVGVGVGDGEPLGVGVGVSTTTFVILKLLSETSKKTLFTASTLILAVLVLTFGIATFALPLLGTDAASTVGNVCPPSVDSEILTFAVLTGAAVVFATFQVTVWVVPGG
jgi:hypothetical protein